MEKSKTQKEIDHHTRIQRESLIFKETEGLRVSVGLGVKEW